MKSNLRNVRNQLKKQEDENLLLYDRIDYLEHEVIEKKDQTIQELRETEEALKRELEE